MASQFQIAKKHAGSLIRAAQTGTPQQSKVWGKGQHRREVTVWHDGNGVYTTAFNSQGAEMTYATDDAEGISGMVTMFLGEAG